MIKLKTVGTTILDDLRTHGITAGIIYNAPGKYEVVFRSKEDMNFYKIAGRYKESIHLIFKWN